MGSALASVPAAQALALAQALVQAPGWAPVQAQAQVWKQARARRRRRPAQGSAAAGLALPAKDQMSASPVSSSRWSRHRPRSGLRPSLRRAPSWTRQWMKTRLARMYRHRRHTPQARPMRST
jgi:hypothetical protein